MSKEKVFRSLKRLTCVVMVMIMVTTCFVVNVYADETTWGDAVKERVMAMEKEGDVYFDGLNIPLAEYGRVIEYINDLMQSADGFWMESNGVGYYSGEYIYNIYIYVKDEYVNEDGTINKIKAKEDYNNIVYRAQNGEAAQVIKEIMATMDTGYKAFVVSDFKIPVADRTSVFKELSNLLYGDKDYHWVDIINVVNDGDYVKEFKVWAKDKYLVNNKIDKDAARADFEYMSESLAAGKIEHVLKEKFDEAIENMEPGESIRVCVDDIMYITGMTFAEVNAIAKNVLNSVEYSAIASYRSYTPCPIIQRYYYYLMPGDYFDEDGNLDRLAAIEGYYRYDLLWQELTVLLSSDMSDLEKVLLVHEWVVRECEYDYARYLAGTLPEEANDTKGVVENGLAVCQGYSYALSYFLNRAGIENGYVTSYSINHMWNYVKIDGEYYFIDATWNDHGKDSDMEGQMFHKLFLKSGEEFVGLGHEEWEYLGIVADDSDSYPNYIFREDATSSKNNLSYYDGYWYYLTSDYNITKARIDGSEKSVFATYDEKVVNAYVYGDYMYVATQTKVYKIDMTGQKEKSVIYDITKTELGDVIEEFVLKNKKLKIDSGDNTEYLDVEVKEYTATLSKSELSIRADSTSILTVTTDYENNSEVVWFSTDNGIASVENGVITAHAVGQVEIVAVINGDWVVCDVTVNAKIVYGDADGDGNIDVTDAVVLKKYLAGVKNVGADKTASDVNKDGNIDVADAVILMKHLAGQQVGLG